MIDTDLPASPESNDGNHDPSTFLFASTFKLAQNIRGVAENKDGVRSSSLIFKGLRAHAPPGI